MFFSTFFVGELGRRTSNVENGIFLRILEMFEVFFHELETIHQRHVDVNHNDLWKIGFVAFEEVRNGFVGTVFKVRFNGQLLNPNEQRQVFIVCWRIVHEKELVPICTYIF